MSHRSYHLMRPELRVFRCTQDPFPEEVLELLLERVDTKLFVRIHVAEVYQGNPRCFSTRFRQQTESFLDVHFVEWRDLPNLCSILLQAHQTRPLCCTWTIHWNGIQENASTILNEFYHHIPSELLNQSFELKRCNMLAMTRANAESSRMEEFSGMMRNMMEFVTNNKNIKSFTIEGPKYVNHQEKALCFREGTFSSIKEMQHLEELVLTGTFASGQLVAPLVDLLGSPTTKLKRLILRHNRITEDDISKLAKAVGASKTLQEFWCDDVDEHACVCLLEYLHGGNSSLTLVSNSSNNSLRCIGLPSVRREIQFWCTMNHYERSKLRSVNSTAEDFIGVVMDVLHDADIGNNFLQWQRAGYEERLTTALYWAVRDNPVVWSLSA